jgi:hypothetical protein
VIVVIEKIVNENLRNDVRVVWWLFHVLTSQGKGGKRSHDKIGVDLLPENFEWLRIGLEKKKLT